MYCPACGGPLPHHPPVACPHCAARHWRNAKPCGGALVTHGGRLLLVRRNHAPWLDHWDIPGGFCGAEEHPIAAAEREVLEETGLRVEVTGYLGIWLDAYADAPAAGPPDITLNVYYHARLHDDPSRARLDAAEVSELGWFPPDALPEAIAFPNHARTVLHAWRDAYRAGLTQTPLPDRPAESL